MTLTRLNNEPADITPSDDEPAVRKLQKRLQKAFASPQADANMENIECFRVINYFLRLTGWAQGRRRVFEAMPHADTITSIAAFRSAIFRLGFHTNVEPVVKANLREEYLPCFVHSEDGRVILVTQQNADGSVKIYDPQQECLRDIEFDALDGIAIFPEIIKTDAPANQRQRWSTSVLKAFSPVFRQIFIISFAINLFALAPPLYVMTVYDKAIGAQAIDVLIGLTIGIAAIIAADFALRKIRNELQAYLGARLDEQLNETAFRRLLHLSLSHTEGAPIGAQLTRLKQMTSLQDAFTGPLAGAIFDMPFLVLFIIVIAIIGGPLVWAPIALIAAYGVIAAYALPRMQARITKAGNLKAKLNDLSIESLTQQQAIHDLAGEHIWLRRHRQLSAETAIASMQSRQLNFLIQTLSQSLVAIAGIAIIALGVGMVIDGSLSAGALIAVMALSWRVLGPIRNLFLSGLTIGQTLQSVQQIDRLMRMEQECDPAAKPTIPRTFTGNISFDKVSFRYPSAMQPSLSGVSFSAKAGELVCLYGKSGSGTSTALRLMMGLYQQQAGSIYVDRLDLRQLNKSEWRQAISVAMQSQHLFHGTVYQNIRLACPEAKDSDIQDLVKALGIDAYFGSPLHDGLETRCSKMSRSTWPDALVARIYLARAFVKKAPVYLLDEPGASLDADGERALLKILEEKRKTSAILMTTQRPSHMRIADKVVWLEDGFLRDIGPAETLVPKILAA